MNLRRPLFALTAALAALAALALAPPAHAGGGGTYNWSLGGDGTTAVSGQVTATDNGDGTTTVVVHVEGYAGGDRLLAAVHDGTRQSYKPESSFPLADVVDGTSTTVLPISLMELTSTSRVLLLHDPSGVVAYAELSQVSAAFPGRPGGQG